MIGAFVQNAVEDLWVAEAHGAARVAVHAALSIHLDADQTERADRFVETTQGAERPAPYALGVGIVAIIALAVLAFAIIRRRNKH